MALLESGEAGQRSNDYVGLEFGVSSVSDLTPKVHAMERTVIPNLLHSRLAGSIAIRERFLFALQRVTPKEGMDVGAEAEDYERALGIATDEHVRRTSGQPEL
jgi:hypothetical protein